MKINFQSPERIKGAIRYRVDNSRIRIDTTQHTIDAFMKIIKVFGDDESLSRNLIPDQSRGWGHPFKVRSSTTPKHSKLR